MVLNENNNIITVLFDFYNLNKRVFHILHLRGNIEYKYIYCPNVGENVQIRSITSYNSDCKNKQGIVLTNQIFAIHTLFLKLVA